VCCCDRLKLDDEEEMIKGVDSDVSPIRCLSVVVFLHKTG
jgi:hypothetical protein